MQHSKQNTGNKEAEQQNIPETSSEDCIDTLKELIIRLWLPVDGFADSDVQLTNSQVEDILLDSASCEFSREQMIQAMNECGLKQKNAGEHLFWLIKRKK